MNGKFINFLKGDLFPPILLLIVTALALIANNSNLSGIYESIINYKGGVIFGDISLIKPMLLWVNDGLMAIFFFWVGLEVKKEILQGELNSLKKASLPLIAASGGVIVPAIIFMSLNPDDIKGFAIPTATDIAFAYGVLLLLGDKIPSSLKIFLLSLAIFDDLAAIVLIAVFYTNELSFLSLGLASICIMVLVIFNYLNITYRSFYVLIGIIMWLCVLKSGVHATLTGIICAFFIPMYKKDKTTFLKDIMNDLTPYVNYIILPIFAFFNAGISLGGIGIDSFNTVFFGAFLGLLVGKQVGVFGFCLIASKFGFSLPSSKIKLYGVALLTGIGFTMSFFINTLVYDENPLFFNSAKLAVLSASFLSAILGYIWLKFICKD